MDRERVRKDIALGFEYSYLYDDWVTPLEEALTGLDSEWARWKASPDSTSIWEIVLHLAVWNENIVARIRSGEAVHPSEGSWPSVSKDSDWDAAKRRLWDALGLVRTTLETTPFETLLNAPYGLADLLCRLTHNGYHLGQITKIREWMGSLREPWPTEP